jgi:hypothetical protein
MNMTLRCFVSAEDVQDLRMTVLCETNKIYAPSCRRSKDASGTSSDMGTLDQKWNR